MQKQDLFNILSQNETNQSTEEEDIELISKNLLNSPKIYLMISPK